MRIDIAELLRGGPREAEPSADLPDVPLAGSRGQRLQRLQVGLFGIATMILMVGLANIITSRAERTDQQVVAEAAAHASPDAQGTAQANDPLAEAGVVPGVPADKAPPAAAPAASAGAATQAPVQP